MRKCRLKALGLPSVVLEPYLVKPIRDSDQINYEAHKFGKNPASLIPSNKYSLKDVFRERGKKLANKKVLEVACGTGDFINAYAMLEPKTSFIGVDYAYPVIERGIKKAAQNGLGNVVFYSGRVEDFLEHDFSDERFDLIFVNFPDPWPKKRHLKRRIIQPKIVDSLATALVKDGKIITATDLDYLYTYHLEVLNGCLSLKDANWAIHEPPVDIYHHHSVYQKKGLDKERKIHYTLHLKL